jgi:hypothetical protein
MTISSDDDRDDYRLSDRSHGNDAGGELLRQAQSAASNLSFEEMAAQLRALTMGRRQIPSEVLLRESRDER